VVSWYEARNIFSCSNTGIKSWNSTQGMGLSVFSVFFLSWMGRDHEQGPAICPSSCTNYLYDPQFQINLERNRPESLARQGKRRIIITVHYVY
jgi:hypothetical protein